MYKVAEPVGVVAGGYTLTPPLSHMLLHSTIITPLHTQLLCSIAIAVHAYAVMAPWCVMLTVCVCVSGIVPTTNPTSTAIFKALLALKTRNSLILCPHPRARKSTIAAAKIVHDAAVAAGAPQDIISWVENPSLPVSNALMQAREISLILATGGPAMVRAAYSSGHPSVGVGAGNTPAVIDETASVQMAVSSILLSKTFDNGVICASEQSVVVVDKVSEGCP